MGAFQGVVSYHGLGRSVRQAYYGFTLWFPECWANRHDTRFHGRLPRQLCTPEFLKFLEEGVMAVQVRAYDKGVAAGELDIVKQKLKLPLPQIRVSLEC